MNSASTDRASRADIRAGRKTFVATVVAVYLAMFASLRQSFTPAQIVELTAAGGAYLLVGLFGAEFYIRTGSAFVLALFYAFEIPLAGLIVYWTAGFFLAGLIMLPLASLAVQVLPRRWMLAVCVLLVVTLSAAYGLSGGLEAALLAGIGYLAASVFVVFVTQVAVREREARAEVERLADELSEANRKLREYAAQAEELAITRERARLAHEIHDTVGHTLTALDVQLELLARLPSGQAEQRRQAAEQAVHIHTACQVKGEVTPLPPRLALPLYRAAQEALTNVQRHAPAARQVTLQLRFGPGAVTLFVKNTPPARRASPPPAGGTEGGYGLRGLRERAEALGGTFSAGPDGTGGFRVEMKLPVSSQQ